MTNNPSHDDLPYIAAWHTFMRGFLVLIISVLAFFASNGWHEIPCEYLQERHIVRYDKCTFIWTNLVYLLGFAIFLGRMIIYIILVCMQWSDFNKNEALITREPKKLSKKHIQRVYVPNRWLILSYILGLTDEPPMITTRDVHGDNIPNEDDTRTNVYQLPYKHQSSNVKHMT